MDKLEVIRFFRMTAHQLREITTIRRAEIPRRLLAVAQELDRRADDLEANG